MYAIGLLNNFHTDPKAVSAMIRSAASLRTNYVGPDALAALLHFIKLTGAGALDSAAPTQTNRCYHRAASALKSKAGGYVLLPLAIIAIGHPVQ
jgi:hypothetical protein